MLGGGRVRRTPCEGEAVIGQVVRSWLRRVCTPSRAVALRAVLSGWCGVRGFGSLAVRWPRSKV